MRFDSLEFWAFLAIVLAVAPWLPRRPQNGFLLLCSYLFYAAWDWRFLGLLVFSTLVDWGLGLALARASGGRTRRALLALSLAVNLGVLGFFKYAGFFADSLCALAAGAGLALPPFALEVVLPVGVSFYTFQSLSYTIDVYRGHLPATRSLLDFALFVAFFPQLVAGPIERAGRLLPQVASARRPTLAGAGSGLALAQWGLFKKVVVADNVAPLVDLVYAPAASPTGVEVIVATWAFAAQIYCDFSGYSDIARGVARMLGFELSVNFDRPYLAASPAEFWRRWHVSLSGWLRDYLYVPLGGNRGGPAATARNLMVTMLLGGLWHGAAWTFVAWGAWHGLLLVVLRRWRGAAPGGRGVRVVSTLVTFHLVCVGWVLFRATSLEHALRLLATVVFEPSAGLSAAWLPILAALLAPLAVVEWAQGRRGTAEPWLRLPTLPRAVFYAAVGAAILVLGEDGGAPFIYFQF